MRADRRVTLRGADLLDREVTQREVHFPSSPAGGLGGKSDPREEALSHPVMTTVLLEAGESSGGEPALPPESRDQSQLFERSEMGQGRRGPHAQTRGDLVEARAAKFSLTRPDRPKGLDLAMRQALEGLHVRTESPTILIGIPNY
jgi:hypothetical protein